MPKTPALVLALLEERDDPVDAVVHAFDSAARDLVASGDADGCPAATMALDVVDTNEALRGAAADVVAAWVEGAFLLARTTRDPEPMRSAGRTRAAQLAAAR
ncbi:hypothetical protein [Isoptericola sp. QY 916]|uniref:LmrA/YxaF family transcription factor n=1 Tax=Isoptericola sp. QY 916 TaxID=2782570 RepID=UPI003D2FAC96|nr:hypothetical protein [Isoptericola sp. QY 916]